MGFLFKYKIIFFLLFIFCLLIGLYYYFNNYTTLVKQQFSESRSSIMITILESEKLSQNVNRKVSERLPEILQQRIHLLESLLVNEFDIKHKFILSRSDHDLSFLINHNYKFDQIEMDKRGNNLVKAIIKNYGSIEEELNLFVQNDYKENIRNLNMLDALSNNSILDVKKQDTFYDLSLQDTFYDLSLNDEVKNIKLTDLLMISQSFIGLLDYAQIEKNNIIIRQPKFISINDILKIKVYSLRERTISITSYSYIYYLLIIFGFVNILIYLYLGLKERKII